MLYLVVILNWLIEWLFYLPLVIIGGAALFWFVVGKVPLKYNLQNLMVRWRLTLLTALAFTLVVALMTVMLAFVNGMYNLTKSSGHPGNVIVLSDGALDELFSNLGYKDTSDVERQLGVLRDDDDNALCSKEVYFVVNQPIPGAENSNRKRRFLSVRGLDDPVIAGKVHNLSLKPGGVWFSPAGVETVETSEGGNRTIIQAVIGSGLARELGKDKGKEVLVVGDTFEAGPRTWMVVGILDSSGSTFDSEIWAKRQLVGPIFGKTSYSTLVLRTANAAEAQRLKTELTTNFKKAALQAQVETEYYEKLNGTNQQFLGVIIFITLVMAVGGTFGVMNTMFAAVNARIKDVGVLRIIGYSRVQILVSFLIEALVISLIGGLIGLALGSLTHGWTATSIIGSGQGGGKSVVLKLAVDGRIIGGAILFSLVMGLLGGLLPSIAAMRVKPLDSLR